MDAEIVGKLIWCLEFAAAFSLNISGLFLLATQKRKQVIDIILIHLTVVDLLNILLDGLDIFMLLIVEKTTLSKYIQTVVLFIVILQIINVFLVTFDRTLIVKFKGLYRERVTVGRTMLMIVAAWMIALPNIVIHWYPSRALYYKIIFGWDVSLVVAVCISYTYIFVNLFLRQKKLSPGTQQPSVHRPNITVPVFIVITNICFYTIPDFLLASRLFPYSIWFPVMWYFNYICDPVIYIFGMRKFRKRLKKSCFMCDGMDIPIQSSGPRRFSSSAMARRSSIDCQL